MMAVWKARPTLGYPPIQLLNGRNKQVIEDLPGEVCVAVGDVDVARRDFDAADQPAPRCQSHQCKPLPLTRRRKLT